MLWKNILWNLILKLPKKLTSVKILARLNKLLSKLPTNRITANLQTKNLLKKKTKKYVRSMPTIFLLLSRQEIQETGQRKLRRICYKYLPSCFAWILNSPEFLDLKFLKGNQKCLRNSFFFLLRCRAPVNCLKFLFFFQRFCARKKNKYQLLSSFFEMQAFLKPWTCQIFWHDWVKKAQVSVPKTSKKSIFSGFAIHCCLEIYFVWKNFWCICDPWLKTTRLPS